MGTRPAPVEVALVHRQAGGNDPPAKAPTERDMGGCREPSFRPSPGQEGSGVGGRESATPPAKVPEERFVGAPHMPT